MKKFKYEWSSTILGLAAAIPHGEDLLLMFERLRFEDDVLAAIKRGDKPVSVLAEPLAKVAGGPGKVTSRLKTFAGRVMAYWIEHIVLIGERTTGSTRINGNSVFLNGTPFKLIERPAVQPAAETEDEDEPTDIDAFAVALKAVPLHLLTTMQRLIGAEMAHR